jgi:hypothetical protein
VRHKARDNLSSARILLDAGLVDPAASRLYYAIFQAAVDWMSRMGRRPDEFTRGAKWWRHDVIVRNASLVRRSVPDLRLFKELQSMRIQADYQASRVEREDLVALFDSAAHFVEEVCS